MSKVRATGCAHTQTHFTKTTTTMMTHTAQTTTRTTLRQGIPNHVRPTLAGTRRMHSLEASQAASHAQYFGAFRGQVPPFERSRSAREPLAAQAAEAVGEQLLQAERAPQAAALLHQNGDKGACLHACLPPRHATEPACLPSRSVKLLLHGAEHQ